MKFSINTLEQLDKEIEKLQLQKEITKSGFSQSLQRTQLKAKKIVFEKASLSSLAVGAGVLAVKMTTNFELEEKSKNTFQQKNKSALLSLTPILIPVLRSFLSKKNIDLNSIMDSLASSAKSSQTNDLTNL